MTHTIITIQPDGTRSEQFAKPELELLQSAVGGYIEHVPHFDKFEGRKCRAYVNEEGAISDMPFNPHATELWKAGGYRYAQPLYGPLVITVKGPHTPA